MDEDTRSRVFEKFFQAQTAEKKQGFGLGLAICTLIVESHHGKLGVDSAPGKGSAFWFEIPELR
jgi:signal transduction histidine kinase